MPTSTQMPKNNMSRAAEFRVLASTGDWQLPSDVNFDANQLLPNEIQFVYYGS
jgi:hypothetical protein